MINHSRQTTITKNYRIYIYICNSGRTKREEKCSSRRINKSTHHE